MYQWVAGGKDLWKFVGRSGDRKAAYLEGPNELSLEIDTDDVGEEVEEGIQLLLKVLNQNWPR
jgi:hypothetical protein